MSLRLQWLRMSDSLELSKCGRFICSFWAGEWYAVGWDGVGWGFIGEPMDGLAECKARCERYRWFGPLLKVASA